MKRRWFVALWFVVLFELVFLGCKASRPTPLETVEELITVRGMQYIPISPGSVYYFVEQQDGHSLILRVYKDSVNQEGIVTSGLLPGRRCAVSYVTTEGTHWHEIRAAVCAPPPFS